MFQECISLTELNINNIHITNIQDMSFMFDKFFALVSKILKIIK